LVVPTAASALLGKSGAFAVLVLVFMAVTSASSAELIAVSAIFTYDIYRTYIRPGANGKQVIYFSHVSVALFGVFMGVLAIILKTIGIDLGYLYSFMGIATSPAVLPIAFTITWKKQPAGAAITASIVGLICGIAAWLITAVKLHGVITIKSTGENYPMLAGNVVALGVSGIVAVVWSLAAPADFDFNITKTKLEILTDDEIDGNAVYEDPIETDPVRLKKASTFAVWSSVVLTVVLIFLWPLPMYFSGYIFSKPFFAFWVSISIIWALCSTMAVAVYPIFESWGSISAVILGMWGDVTGKKTTTTTKTDHVVKTDVMIIEKEDTVNEKA